MRTTIYLSETLHQRLQIASKRRNQSVSQLAQDLLDRALADEEKVRLDKMYTALEGLEGFIKTPVKDASTTIDEVLYGKHGIWRGTIPPEEHE